MSFKEYIKNDINNSFIQSTEFAEMAMINNVEVLVVEDSDKLEYKIKKDYDGLIIGDILFYISSDEYLKIPYVNQPEPISDMKINYKGKPCTVINVNKQMGVYEIILQYAGGGY